MNTAASSPSGTAMAIAMPTSISVPTIACSAPLLVSGLSGPPSPTVLGVEVEVNQGRPAPENV